MPGSVRWGVLSERSLKVRRLLREQEQTGAVPVALTISRDAKSRCRPGPHRPGCGGSTPPSCRDWVASIAAMQRSLKPQSTGQHRGDPPFHAGVAQQRQQQFRKLPGNPPHGSASLPVGPISCSRSSNYQSGRLRTARLQVRVLPGVPFHAALAQLPEALRSERRGWGWKSLTRHHFAHVVQRRDGALKTRTVSVQIRPWAPTACSPISRGVPLKTGRLQVQVLPRGPFLECQPGKRTGPRC